MTSAAPRSRRELTLVACALLLPIPLLAATGLGVPLAAPVERGLASLLPFAAEAQEGSSTAADGSAAATAGEGSAAGQPVSGSSARSPAAAAPRIGTSSAVDVIAPTSGTSGSRPGPDPPDGDTDPAPTPEGGPEPTPHVPTAGPAEASVTPAGGDNELHVEVDAGDVDASVEVSPSEGVVVETTLGTTTVGVGTGDALPVTPDVTPPLPGLPVP